MRNTLKAITVVAVALVSVLSVNAQNLGAIEDLNTTNWLSDEGTKPIRDLNCLYTMTMNRDSICAISSDAPISINTHDFVLPPSTISDSEIAVIEFQAKAYIDARISRNANAPKPHYSIASLRSIYPNNEQKVQEIAYGKMTVEQIVENELALKVASEKQTRTGKTITAVANGY